MNQPPSGAFPGSDGIQRLGPAGAAPLFAAKADTREVNWFDVPEELAKEVGVTKVGLVEITAGEEVTAARRAGMNVASLALEYAKESLRWVNDAPISMNDLSGDAFWSSTKAGMAPLRSLITSAYSVIHNPKGGQTDTFLKSRRRTIG